MQNARKQKAEQKAETWQAPGGKTVEPWLSETFCKEIEGVFSEEEGIKDKLELK